MPGMLTSVAAVSSLNKSDQIKPPPKAGFDIILIFVKMLQQ